MEPLPQKADMLPTEVVEALPELWIFGYGSLVWRPSFEHDLRLPACLPGFKRRFWQGSRDHRGTDEDPGRVVTLLPATGADEENEVTWGMAYRVPERQRKSVLEYLDVREKGGYSQVLVDIHIRDLDSSSSIPPQSSTNSLDAKTPLPHDASSDPASPVSSPDDGEALASTSPPSKAITINASSPSQEYAADLSSLSKRRALVYIGTTTNIAYLGCAPQEEIAAQIVQCVGPSGPNIEYLLQLADGLRRLKCDDPHVFDLERRALRIMEAQKESSTS